MGHLYTVPMANNSLVSWLTFIQALIRRAAAFTVDVRERCCISRVKYLSFLFFFCLRHILMKEVQTLKCWWGNFNRVHDKQHVLWQQNSY